MTSKSIKEELIPILVGLVARGKFVGEGAPNQDLGTPVKEATDQIITLLDKELIGELEAVPLSIFEYGDDDQRKYWYNRLRKRQRQLLGVEK